MKLTRLTSAEFDRIVGKSRMNEQTKAMARAVLVDGRPKADVAAENGLSKQRMTLVMRSVHRAYQKTTMPANSWISMEIELPEGLAIELDEVTDKLKNITDETQCAKAISALVQALRTARNNLR